MKQKKKLTRDQKIQLANAGKDPKDYAAVYQDGEWIAVRKDGRQDEVADRNEGCRK